MQEYRRGGGYINEKNALSTRQTEIKMGHPQVPTPLQFYNKCSHGILTGVLKQKQSKYMDMQFYCLCDRSIEQKKTYTLETQRTQHRTLSNKISPI